MNRYSDAEHAHWQDRAALLDPAAYVFLNTESAAQTVPAEACWYVLNSWALPTRDGAGTFFTRQATVDAAWMLSAGTVIRETAAAVGLPGSLGLNGFVYVCKPEKVTTLKTVTVTTTAGSRLVTATAGTFDTTHDPMRPVAGPGIPDGVTIDSCQSATAATLSVAATATGSSALIVGDRRYADDPRALYYARRHHLRNARQLDVHCQIPSGAAVGTYIDAPLPAVAQFPAAMLMASSLNNGSWLLLVGPAGNMNLLDEISDDHEWRSGRGVLLPFRTRDFTAIRMKYGSVSGNGTDTQYLGAQGAVAYTPLPAGF